MGKMDMESKRYLSENSYFSDLFNYILYDGEQVILPENLKELDTSEIIVPYGNGVRTPKQKYRDLIRLWSAKTDGSAVYMMLGVEIQDKMHYAMPVRNGLYDMIGYANQVEESSRSYRRKKRRAGTDPVVESEARKVKLTDVEFLSGFRKTDKLIPIITVTV